MPVISKKVKRGYNHFSGIIRGAGDAVDIDCPDCDSKNIDQNLFIFYNNLIIVDMLKLKFCKL